MHKAIILAAGRGKRMGSLTENKPKCMTPLLKKPLLEWALESLRGAGCHPISIVTGYQRHCLDAYLLTQFVNERWFETNMVRSLLEASTWLEQFPCIVSYSDIFFSKETVSALIDCEAPLAISYDPEWKIQWGARFQNPLDDAETFKINKDGCVYEIGNKTKHMHEIQGQYMGLLKITPDAWHIIKKKLNELTADTIDQLDMTSLLQLLIQYKASIKAVPCEGVWGEIDTMSDWRYFNKLLSE